MIELTHDCPKSGFSCPDCDEQEKLAYRIKQDEYVCGACGVVSTVNEVVAYSKEKEKDIDWIEHYTAPDGGQSSNSSDRGQEGNG